MGPPIVLHYRTPPDGPRIAAHHGRGRTTMELRMQHRIHRVCAITVSALAWPAPDVARTRPSEEHLLPQTGGGEMPGAGSWRRPAS
jgi:hypothetical protein